MKRRIIFIAPSAFTLGGVQSWLDYIVPGLEGLGWSPVVGLVSGRRHDAEAYLRDHPFDAVRIISSTTGTREGRVRSLMETIRTVQPAVVVVSNIVDAYVAISRLRAANVGDLKVVAALHAIAPDFLQDFERYRDHLDAVVSTNLLGCDLVEHVCGLARKRIFHAPGGVEIPDSGMGHDEAVRAEGTALRIAYVGRLERFYKRVYDVLDIVEAALSGGLDLKLTLAGDGPERDHWLASARQRGLGGRIEYIGALNRQELRDCVFRSNDVLLLTSSSETGPLVAWEAMAYGLGLVTSDFVGRKREGRLRDGVNSCVFPVGDTNTAVECLLRMRDPKVRAALSEAGRELVQGHYSQSSSIQRWSDCLERISNLPPLPPCPVTDWMPMQGKLDRIFGPDLAETLRRHLGRKFEHSDPGGEWPHSYGGSAVDDCEFWELASRFDAGEDMQREN